MLALPSPQRTSKSFLAKHEDHSDVSRWHIPGGHEAPGAAKFIRRCARNALPDSIAHFFHPTRATLAAKDDGHEVTQLWSSRKHRKHWYQYRSPAGASRHRDTVWGKIALMRKFEYWNISWWVAQAFTWGSVVWVINGFAVFLPFCNSHFEKAPNSSGWTAFIGATIFEFGSVFGIWEAWNADTHAFEFYMGRAAASVKGDLESVKKVVKDTVNHNGRKSESTPHVSMGESSDAGEKSAEKETPNWVWFSTDTKYWHELGWYAAFVQFLAASIFWISGFTAIPVIQDAISSHTGVLDGVFWVPQVVGGTGFIISSIIIMLESQHIWWLPNLKSLGWHVGFWNFVGGVGFTLSGAFGISTSHWAQYQCALSTFWGGWAFLIGSVIQWYESVNTV